MKFLLDASALLPVIMKSGKKLIADASQIDLLTTDLAIYESGNGLWAMAVLTNKTTLENAQDTIASINEFISRSLISAINFTSIDLHAVLSLAETNHMTFYEASYIVATQKTNSVLVTEDKKLFKIACKYVKVMSVAELEQEIGD